MKIEGFLSYLNISVIKNSSSSREGSFPTHLILVSRGSILELESIDPMSIMWYTLAMPIITTIIGHQVSSLKQKSLTNKHLVIAGEYWNPYLMWTCPGFGLDWEEDCPNERTYDGVMWQLILFMQQARNFTFTLVHQADYEWGLCYAKDNCTGMIGMVNRKEVDFALGN